MPYNGGMPCKSSSRRRILNARLARTCAQDETSCGPSILNRSCRSASPSRRSPSKKRSESDDPFTNPDRYYLRTKQYSINALTDSSGTIKERYAYDAYGGLSIFDGNGTARTATAEANRYTYTGREWDDEPRLFHYRARMYDSIAGRFCSRDPIGYWDGQNLYRAYFAPNFTDPNGLERTKTDAECCAEYSKRRRGRVKGGMVICCEGDYVPCVFFKPSGSNKADDIVDSCGIEHEKDHFDDIKPCLKVRVKNQCYRPSWKYPDDVDTEEEKDDFENREECKAYAIELKCLLNKITQ